MIITSSSSSYLIVLFIYYYILLLSLLLLFVSYLYKERIQELGAEYWIKACAKSHAFAVDSFEADAMLLDDDVVEPFDDLMIHDNNIEI